MRTRNQGDTDAPDAYDRHSPRDFRNRTVLLCWSDDVNGRLRSTDAGPPSDREPAMIEECLAVEFDVSGDDCPLARATERADVQIECGPPQLRDDGNVLLHFTAPPSDEFAEALDGDDRVRYLHRSRGDARDTYRCLSKHPCVVHELTNAGFMAETLTYRDGEERHTGAVVGNEVLQGVMAAAGDAVGVRLRRVYPVGPESSSVAGRWDLTPAQAAAIRTALSMGYFSVPKEATATEVAEEMGISKTAFLERLRRGQAGLFEQVFG